MADSLFSGSYDGLNMPYSPEAEQAVLGAIILDSTVFDKVVDYIKSPDYFYVALHKIIFMQMQETEPGAGPGQTRSAPAAARTSGVCSPSRTGRSK